MIWPKTPTTKPPMISWYEWALSDRRLVATRPPTNIAIDGKFTGRLPKVLPKREVISVLPPNPYIIEKQNTTIPPIPAICALILEKLFTKNTRNNEIIELSSPFIMNYGGYKGFLYDIEFCNQFIDKGIVKNKSQKFSSLTQNIIAWMKKNYVSYRGKYSYDNEKEHKRLFADKYMKYMVKNNNWWR